MIEKAVNSLLENDPAVAALVSDRIYAYKLPGTVTYPCVLVFEVSHPRIADADIFYDRVQLSCFARTFTDAENLATVCQTAIGDYRGVVEGFAITSISYVDRRIIYDDATKTVQCAVDVRIKYRKE